MPRAFFKNLFKSTGILDFTIARKAFLLYLDNGSLGVII